jgi:hypothetical protein
MFMFTCAFGAGTRSIGLLEWRKGVFWVSREVEFEKQRRSIRVLGSMPSQALAAEELRLVMASLLAQKQSWEDLPSQFENEEVSALLMVAFWFLG